MPFTNIKKLFLLIPVLAVNVACSDKSTPPDKLTEKYAFEMAKRDALCGGLEVDNFKKVNGWQEGDVYKRKYTYDVKVDSFEDLWDGNLKEANKQINAIGYQELKSLVSSVYKDAPTLKKVIESQTLPAEGSFTAVGLYSSLNNVQSYYDNALYPTKKVYYTQKTKEQLRNIFNNISDAEINGFVRHMSFALVGSSAINGELETCLTFEDKAPLQYFISNLTFPPYSESDDIHVNRVVTVVSRFTENGWVVVE